MLSTPTPDGTQASYRPVFYATIERRSALAPFTLPTTDLPSATCRKTYSTTPEFVAPPSDRQCQSASEGDPVQYVVYPTGLSTLGSVAG